MCNVALQPIREQGLTCVSVAWQAFVCSDSHPAGCSVEELHDRVRVKGGGRATGDRPAAGGQPGPGAGRTTQPGKRLQLEITLIITNTNTVLIDSPDLFALLVVLDL